MIERRRVFDGKEQLAHGLAHDVAVWLNEAIAKNGSALLAVSGGSTPKPFFAALSNMKLAWSKVKVTLVDERQVPEESDRSNARLVKQSLLQNLAAAATFIPLYENPEAANLPAFDVVILGMGHDGHTASFFPGGDHLARALDMKTPEAILTMNAPGAGEPRLTFSLARLLHTAHLCLHIEGQDKMKVLDAALAQQDAMQMPVRAVLNATKPLTLYWCP
jgi:6-phosphogluconolactonase